MEYSNMNWIDPHDEWNDDDCVKAGCLHIAGILLAVFLGILACALLGSCTTTKYVPVIEHKVDTVLVNHTAHDSIYVHDSTIVKEKGDTVWYERWHTKYVNREVHDTTYISKTDSIPTPYPVEKRVEVEKQLTWWQELRLRIANIALVVLGVLGVGWIVKKKLL